MGSLRILSVGILLVAIVKCQLYSDNVREVPADEGILVTNEGYQPIMAKENTYDSDGLVGDNSGSRNIIGVFSGSRRKRQYDQDMIHGDIVRRGFFSNLKAKLKAKWAWLKNGVQKKVHSLSGKLAKYTQPNEVEDVVDE